MPLQLCHAARSACVQIVFFDIVHKSAEPHWHYGKSYHAVQLLRQLKDAAGAFPHHGQYVALDPLDLLRHCLETVLNLL